MPDDPNSERSKIDQLLGDTRRRFYQRKTPLLSSERLKTIDGEIRVALAQPPSPELDVELQKLSERLRALDPR